MNEFDNTDYKEDSQKAEQLVEAIKNAKNYNEVLKAHKLLEKIFKQLNTETLINFLYHPNSTIRTFSAIRLGKSNNLQAIPYLANILIEDANSNVRDSAAKALGIIGDIQVINSLLSALEDTESNVRYTAAWALGQLRAESALPFLEKMKNDDGITSDRGRVGDAAVSAIKRIKRLSL